MQSRVFIIIFAKLNKFLLKFRFFNYIHKTLQLYKSPIDKCSC